MEKVNTRSNKAKLRQKSEPRFVYLASLYYFSMGTILSVIVIHFDTVLNFIHPTECICFRYNVGALDVI